MLNTVTRCLLTKAIARSNKFILHDEQLQTSLQQYAGQVLVCTLLDLSGTIRIQADGTLSAEHPSVHADCAIRFTGTDTGQELLERWQQGLALFTKSDFSVEGSVGLFESLEKLGLAWQEYLELKREELLGDLVYFEFLVGGIDKSKFRHKVSSTVSCGVRFGSKICRKINSRVQSRQCKQV